MPSTRYSVAILSSLCTAIAVFPTQIVAEEQVGQALLPSTTPVQQPTADLAPSVPGQTTKPSTRPRVFPRPGLPSPAFSRPFIEPQVTNQTRQALGFYGGYAARTTLSQQPKRTPIQPSAPRPLFRQAKPFQTIYRDPTVSPYLNLHRDETNVEAAPNYFSFVRPQLDQLDSNRRQQRELQQIRGQLQSSSTVVGPQYGASGLPGTGTPARFMDTAQFYGGLRR